VNVDSSGLAVVNVAAYNCRVGIVFDFNAGNPITMDVALFKVAISILEGKNANISSVMYLKEGR
jgi:hypothetical protein